MSRPAQMPHSQSFLALWTVYLVLSPIYVVRSGGMQPADFVLALLMLAMFPMLGSHVRDRLRKPLVAGAWFVVYTGVVSGVLLVLVDDVDRMMYLAPLFYLYDLLAFGIALTLYVWMGDKFLRTSYYALAFAVILEVVVHVVATPTFSGRAIGTFNNPNQLGHFVLLCATMFAILADRLGVRRRVLVGLMVATLYLAAVSLSKAAILGIGMLMVLAFLRKPGLVLSVFAVVAVATAIGQTQDVFTRVDERFHQDQRDEDLASRGYDRIVNDPEYLVFGAGEGGYDRFNTKHEIEIHSTFGTVLFSYGVVGLALFSNFLWAVVRAAGVRSTLFLLPLVFYGLTHMGLRFTLFWIVLAVIACIGPGRNLGSASGTSP